MLYTMLCCQYPARARLVPAALHNLHAVKLCTQGQWLRKQGDLPAYTIGQTHCIDSPTRCLLCPQFDDPRDAKLSEKSAQMRFRQRALQGTSQHGSALPHQIQMPPCSKQCAGGLLAKCSLYWSCTSANATHCGHPAQGCHAFSRCTVA